MRIAGSGPRFESENSLIGCRICILSTVTFGSIPLGRIDEVR
jgi:hypothetical protein